VLSDELCPQSYPTVPRATSLVAGATTVSHSFEIDVISVVSVCVDFTACKVAVQMKVCGLAGL
jgi:hypothetical protein